jgi:hypothetical protein
MDMYEVVSELRMAGSAGNLIYAASAAGGLGSAGQHSASLPDPLIRYALLQANKSAVRVL